MAALRRRIWLEAGCFFAAAWLLRVATLWAASWRAAIPWRDLALMFDGHVYVLIARSAPRLYQGIEAFFPAYRDSEYFTGWFPAYPLVIAAINAVVSDIRLSALLASQLLSSLAVAVFFVFAQKTVRRPRLAAALFCVFPATWLLAGSLAFVESAYVLGVVCVLYCVNQSRWAAAALLAAIVVVTQKSGILALACLKRWPLRLAALLPLALLLAYWGYVFGEPLIGLRVQREIFGASLFSFPFKALVSGFFSSTQIFADHFWLRKALIASSVAFYAGVLAATRQRRGEPLWRWLALVLAFNACVGGVWGYYAFARFMTAAAPAAILLIVDRLPRWAASAVVIVAAASIWTAALEASDATALMYALWPKGYFASLAAHVP